MLAVARAVARSRLAPLGGVRYSSRVATLTPVDVSSCLTDADIAKFREDGAVVLRGVFPPEWVDELRAAAEDNMANPGPLCDEHASAQGVSGRFHDDQFLWLRHEAFKRFVTMSGMARIAAKAMGSKTCHIFYDQLLVKEPGTSTPTPWHNDTSYWHLSGKQICSTWVALDRVPASSGVSYVRGSHKLALRHAVTNFSGDAHSQRNVYADAGDEFDELPDVDAKVAAGELELLNWDLEPGDVILFDSAAVHGAPGLPPNSTLRRRGYATRWLGDDVRYETRPGTMDKGWKAAGYDNGLENGQPIGCELYPDIIAMSAPS